MYNFEKKIKDQKAIDRIKNFDPNNLSKEDKEFLQYKFPTDSRNCISSSQRGFELQHLSIQSLTKIYLTKATINNFTRSGIATTILFKLFKEQEFSIKDIQSAKDDLLLDMICKDEVPLIQDYAVESVLYILKITIGSNHFYKFGITNNVNNRIRSLKSNIKSEVGYCTRSINIEVIHIESNLSDPKQCEVDIKEMITKKRITKSGYYFKGGITETIHKDHFGRFKKFAKEIIEKYRR